MRDTILSRLAALESAKSQDLMVYCVSPDGEEAILPASECLRHGFGFCRVASGDNLKDLDKLLEEMHTRAIREAQQDK